MTKRTTRGWAWAGLLGLVSAGCSSAPTVSSSSGGSGGTSSVIASGTGGAALGAGGSQAILSGTGVAGGGSESTGDLTDGSCGSTRVEANNRPANVLLVIDRSSSMDDKPTGFSQSKWKALKAALADVLPKAPPSLSLGLELYSLGDSSCSLAQDDTGIQVAVGASSSTADSILSKLDDTKPGGGTPTAAALQSAYNYFVTGGGKSLTGDRFVLLATDGGPNCHAGLSCEADRCVTNLDGNCDSGDGNCCDGAATSKKQNNCIDDASTLEAIQALLTAGIRTIVVGIPGSEIYAGYLDQFAAAGGAANPAAPPSYYAVGASGGVDGLASVLETITSGLITTCKLQLGSQPADTNMLNVLVEGTVIAQSGADGWDLDSSTSPPTIVLKGATCDRVETQGVQSVEVDYGCPTIVSIR